MSDKAKASGTDKEVLRVALDKKAAHAYTQMAERLKAENPSVKVQPSAFVSFLVSDFYANYFEKDIDVLIAEFFDSQSYHETQMQRAKGDGNFEKVMIETLATIKKIKSKTRRKVVRSRKLKQEAHDIARHAKV